MNGIANGTDLNDIVALRGIGGVGGTGGYGYGGSGFPGHGSFASPSANAIRINEGNRAAATGIENLLDQNQFAATNKNIVDGDARICDKLSENANRAADSNANTEFRMSDRLRDVEREIVQNAKEAAICCCDAKLEAAKNTADIMAAVADSKATMLAVEGRNVERSLNAANAELTSLKTQIACGCCTSNS